ncbi:hypothetical protein Sste5344_010598 [Sporothrix stenoceras]
MSNVANGAGSLSTSASNGLASRLPHSRNGSHSIIGSALNSGHRVSRRKSMTSPGATNVAAMAAIIQEAEVLPNGALAINARRNTLAKPGANVASSSLGGFSRGGAMAAAMATAGTNGLIGSLPLPSPPASLPTRNFVTADGSAIDDDLNDMSDGEIDPASLNDASSLAFEIARVRRASDGQPLKEGRRSSRMELRCKQCGKGYKHKWALTSKLLISKHQQVQLLEAASVLVTMNTSPDGEDNAAATPPDSTRDSASENDPASPSASGFSYQHDSHSSVDTTPPPTQMDDTTNADGIKRDPVASYPSPPQAPSLGHMSFSQRFSQPGASAANVARSYQSGLPVGNVSAGFGFAHQRQLSRDNLRPPSSGKNVTGQEDNELAAAVELLSCSFNSGAGDANTVTPGSVQGLGQNVPPVPPVPTQYLGQSATPLGDTSFINSFPSRAPESFTRGDRHRSSIVDDVKMDGSGDSVMDDDEEDTRSRARSDDDDDGVFGRMEE